ncbi:MAG: tetratricopeptide repeat protein [Methylotenera sp.]|nr:tetratricopeptide repeat protein [Methylotenera sp.]
MRQTKNAIITIAQTRLWLTRGLIASTLALSACATNGSYHSQPGQAKTNPEGALTAEFVYRYLIAEVAGQRGDLATSSTIFYELAKTTRNPGLAERAAKISAYGNVNNLTMPAVKLWAELDPSSNEAQQAMTEMLVGSGKLKEARPHLAQLFLKEETRAGGFLYLSTLLSRNPDKAAVLSLVQALAKPYPDLAEAQFAIAQAAWAAQKDGVALTALNQAETLKPDWPIAALLKGQVLFEQNPETAITFYQDFLDQHSDANEIRLNMAKLMVSQKQYAQAKTHFPLLLANAKQGDTKNVAEITAIVGLLSYQGADYPVAESYFLEALKLGFKDADQIHLYLGQVNDKLNRLDASLSWYNKVAPGQHYLEAQVNAATLIARGGEVDKALDKLDNLENLNTQQQIIVIQSEASLLVKAHRHQEAFDLLDKAVKNLPNTAELVYDYALAAERLQKFDLMETELRKTIKDMPKFAAAYNALGYSFADRNIKLNEALSLIEKALSLSPNDHYMLDSLGWVHYRKGNLKLAADTLQQAYQMNPDPEIAAHLGEVLWQQGQRDQANVLLDSALRSHPDNELLKTTRNKLKP